MAPRRPDPLALLTGRLSSRAYPGGIGLPGQGAKFATDGHVQIWPGNTFVCHVDPTSEAFDHLRHLQERVKRSEFGPLFTYLPAPSFHMTVFQGYSPGKDRNDWWPEDLSDLPDRDAISAKLRQKIEGLTLPDFAVKATGLFCGNSVTMQGVDASNEAALREARTRISQAAGYRSPEFDAYVFHVTLSYMIQWLTEATARDLIAFSDEIFAEATALHQSIPLGPCAFCDFESMHHFEPVVKLG